jgi:dTDP-D-glucose 4,6-dehydratase
VIPSFELNCSASHVVILLATKYPTYKIINYDKLDYCASLKNLEAISDLPNYEFVHGDILATDLVNFVVRKEKVDTIMHFAAQSHVGERLLLLLLLLAHQPTS